MRDTYTRSCIIDYYKIIHIILHSLTHKTKFHKNSDIPSVGCKLTTGERFGKCNLD